MLKYGVRIKMKKIYTNLIRSCTIFVIHCSLLTENEITNKLIKFLIYYLPCTVTLIPIIRACLISFTHSAT